MKKTKLKIKLEFKFNNLEEYIPDIEETVFIPRKSKKKLSDIIEVTKEKNADRSNTKLF